MLAVASSCQTACCRLLVPTHVPNLPMHPLDPGSACHQQPVIIGPVPTGWCLQIVMGWILTLVVAGITAGILAAVFVYSPNKLSADDRVFANRLLNQVCVASLVLCYVA